MPRSRYIIILVVAVALSLMAYSLFKEKKAIEASVKTLSAQKTAFESENKGLSANIEYFQNPENLLKEARSQFNYKIEGEHTLVLIPSSTPTSSANR